MSYVENSTGLLKQIEFYQLLVNSIQDYAIFMLDTEGCVASWNLGAQKLKGYQPDEIIGKHFSIFYTPEDLANGKIDYELETCLREGHVEDEYWRVRKDGTRFWANVVITALYDESGNLIGFAKVTRDLTERKSHEDALKRANERLRRQQTELEGLNNAKDEFISLASHQLRTPATGVKQFLGMLLDGYSGELSDVQRKFVLRAYDTNNRQINLVNDLLMVAQVDAGKVKLVYREVNINELIRDVSSEMQDTFSRRKQTLELNLPDDSYELAIDRMRFRMVIENIIDNASKYTPEGGKISVLVKNSASAYDIAVIDNGVGIDETSLPKLFSKFTRIPNSLSDTVSGSGLGLYWANKIVNLHGGKIKVASVVGKGSNFTISLPKRKSND